MGLSDVEKTIRDLADREIARLPTFREELIRGEHRVC